MAKQSMFARCKEIFNDNPDLPRAEVVGLFIAEGCKPNSATVYYSKIKHPNGMPKKQKPAPVVDPVTPETPASDELRPAIVADPNGPFGLMKTLQRVTETPASTEEEE